MECVTYNLSETYELAKKFVAGELPCRCEGRHGATVVALYGELGAGKTSFTQGVAKAFGIKDHITSPTFVLEKIYRLKDSAYKNLIHIDAYRLSGHRDLSALGWDELVKNPENIIFIEWPERVLEALPVDMIRIYLEAGEKEEERRLKIVC